MSSPGHHIDVLAVICLPSKPSRSVDAWCSPWNGRHFHFGLGTSSARSSFHSTTLASLEGHLVSFSLSLGCLAAPAILVPECHRRLLSSLSVSVQSAPFFRRTIMAKRDKIRARAKRQRQQPKRAPPTANNKKTPDSGGVAKGSPGAAKNGKSGTVAYSAAQRLLVVGDGDFSFAKGLVHHLGGAKNTSVSLPDYASMSTVVWTRYMMRMRRERGRGREDESVRTEGWRDGGAGRHGRGERKDAEGAETI